MENILIADAGSTKVDWVLIPASGINSKESVFRTNGLNALLATAEEISVALNEVCEHFKESDITSVYYYGAGCATPIICKKIENQIRQHFKNADEVIASSDLLAAARATLGTKKGIACIIGTGSNSGLYNGEIISRNVPSLGYILGDEGSGAALGKRLVSDAFKGHLPESIKEKFLEKYNMDIPAILDRIYRTSAPNRFLASLVPFLKENIWNPYIYSLVLKEFTQFFYRNISRYPDAHSIPITITGSLAAGFENIVREAASSQGYPITKIVSSPLEGLMEYHRKSVN